MDDKEVEQTEKMIAALCALEEGLTDWEVEFVETVSHWRVTHLSEKQLGIIKQLYERLCP